MPNNRSDEQRAYDRGVERTRDQGKLQSHEERLDAINHSIENTGRELALLKEEVRNVRSDLKMRDKVAAALAAVVKDRAEKQVSTRTFLLGVAGLAVVIILAIVGAR
jgi:hypothetical protein